MKRNPYRWTLLPVALLAALAVAGQQGLAPDLEQQIDAAVELQRAEQKIPAVSVAIATGGELRYAKAFGLADVENNVAATPATRFRTASIAKPMTAVAVLQLAEQGRLDLDAPIQKYCPAFPEKPWPATARQLLGHLGGVRHYNRAGEASGTEHYFTLVDSLKLFSDDPLLHQPGTKFHYTTYGYSVLGCAVEGASGMSYEEYMQKNVWGPAGMTQTVVDNHFLIVSHRTRGYQKLDERSWQQLPPAAQAMARPGEVYNANLHDTSMKVPGGGVLSTPTDLVKFALAVKNAQLIKPETRDAMWTRQKLADGTETNYGLGWGARSSSVGLMIQHSGGQAGTATLLTILPERDIVIAVMTNMSGASPARITREIGRVLTGE